MRGFALFASLSKRRLITVSLKRYCSVSSKYAANSYEKVLKGIGISNSVREAQYAVRGEVPTRALQIEEELKQGNKRPFDHIIFCNVGNPQQLANPPISYVRQVLALCDYPELLSSSQFPSDAKEHAKRILASAGKGGSGAYSNSGGVSCIRQDVVDFIQRRDNHESSVNHVFLTNGASDGISLIMKLLIASSNTGVMVPVPEYPLYSALLSLLGATPVRYYLNEDNNWSIELSELERSYETFEKAGIAISGIVLISPGNPTGQILERSNLEQIIDFAYRKRLVILADEVYQENVYTKQKKFVSVKKVLREMPSKYQDVELASFHSASKGFYGECGRRGGYLEVTNFSDEALEQLYKLASINLCANLNGQIAMSCITRHPRQGMPSYPRFEEERSNLLSSYARRAEMIQTAMNTLEGCSCNQVEGAMYAFPKISIPQKAQQVAKEQGKHPDVLYALSLLEHTGICVVPGSGFGQKPGTFHFRTTILPPEEDFPKVMTAFQKHHEWFLNKYQG
ncbi:hypothetical protein GAYE_SCF05G2603 [Galdieria yellowstonensis]|uniref:Aminotransferase class I/classII large domain-containing protein n=1 Tax=Galdieria yellowstonensis TaxID=3028027 RepID=A0AAV9IB79_9RHOD|nr:hypothetical protein GAYE_SCF05G2603 [Galdieria yellowstonensis]